MIKSIITNINELRKPCELVTKNDDIKSIIQDLKDTLATRKGLALSANQIGIQKRICYCKVPKKVNPQTKEVVYNEFVMINPEIIEKERKFIFPETCLSFPGLIIQTDRYVFITIKFLNENFKEMTASMQDLEAVVAQHECSHLKGQIMFDFKHRRK
jgi:peptide deformylase